MNYCRHDAGKNTAGKENSVAGSRRHVCSTDRTLQWKLCYNLVIVQIRLNSKNLISDIRPANK